MQDKHLYITPPDLHFYKHHHATLAGNQVRICAVMVYARTIQAKAHHFEIW